MKKQYLEPEMNVLPVDVCDVIATSGENNDDTISYKSVWGIPKTE